MPVDLALSPTQAAFRDELLAWLDANPPGDRERHRQHPGVVAVVEERQACDALLVEQRPGPRRKVGDDRDLPTVASYPPSMLAYL